MNIRRVHMADIHVIWDMEKRIFGRHAFNMSALLWGAIGNKKGFFVADGDDGLVGYLIARPAPDEVSCWEIASIAVREESRGQGVGTRLIEEFVEFARQRGAGHVALEVSVLNPRAQSLYRRLGFAASNVIPSYYGPDEDGVKMVLDVAGVKGGKE
jgi:ribosomal-protein-alanine N-acetyltransferase